jgi:hypothetical protein
MKIKRSSNFMAVIVFIILFLPTCKENGPLKEMQPQYTGHRNKDQIGVRFNKNDTGTFNFLIRYNSVDTVLRDKSHPRNIFLIQPRRY